MQHPRQMTVSAVRQALKNLKTTTPSETCKVLKLLDISKDLAKAPHLASYLSRCLFKYAQLVKAIPPPRFRFVRSRDVFYKFRQARTWDQIHSAFNAAFDGEAPGREPPFGFLFSASPKEQKEEKQKIRPKKRRAGNDEPEAKKRSKKRKSDDDPSSGEDSDNETCLLQELSTIQEQFEDVLTLVFQEEEFNEDIFAEIRHSVADAAIESTYSFMASVSSAVRNTSLPQVANLAMWTLRLLGPNPPQISEAERNSIFLLEDRSAD